MDNLDSPTTHILLPLRDTVQFPGVIQSLMVGREASKRAVEEAGTRDEPLVVVAQREFAVQEPQASDLFEVGTRCEVLHVLPLPDGSLRVVFRGLERVHLAQTEVRAGFLLAQAESYPTEAAPGSNTEALRRETWQALDEAVNLGFEIVPEALEAIQSASDPMVFAYLLAHHLQLTVPLKQQILEENHPDPALRHLLQFLQREREVVQIRSDMRDRVEEELGRTQRELLLREQLRALEDELAEMGAEVDRESAQLIARIRASSLPESVEEKAMAEAKRIDRLAPGSAEIAHSRALVELICDLPWSPPQPPSVNLVSTAEILNRAHYGLKDVKERILDYIAVGQLRESVPPSVLCFVGPPGVGKTSFAQSLGKALDRPVVRIALGGIRDEAEIRGHRRTYVGAMPGRIIQAIKEAGVSNPILVLDEVDKIAGGGQGDPASALLEALDPSQNSCFRDHFLEVGYDLSQVLFIATANLLDPIAGPLRDRMEVISFASYTEEEKQAVLLEHILPSVRERHGLSEDQLLLTSAAAQALVREYTMEAGVRGLTQQTEAIARKIARRVVEGKPLPAMVDITELASMLGPAPLAKEKREREPRAGRVHGLVFAYYGGDTIAIEANLAPPVGTSPEVLLTGSMGTVMRESCMAALTYLRSLQAGERYRMLNDAPRFRHDVHVHVPEAAIPKDGPSAGLAIFLGLMSALTGAPFDPNVAVTGEITLHGDVLPVGGIRDKVLAAHRAGFRQVVLPADNEPHTRELPDSVLTELELVFVRRAVDAFPVAFPEIKPTALQIS